jgi:hypothetical protein
VPTKVAIECRNLNGSEDDVSLQRIATVYITDDEDHYVYAPPKARGDPLDWIQHWIVYRPSRDTVGAEVEVQGDYRSLAIQAVMNELKETRAGPPAGMNPDGVHYTAYVCQQGHVLSPGRRFLPPGEHCQECGSPCIDSCQNCKALIRGVHISSRTADYKRPDYCYKCGHPYPWMRDRLETAHELLWNDDKLSLEERKKLWDTLQWVMSNPESDLVPAKKKLMGIKLEKAGRATRELILDFLAKYAAEISKPF